MHIVCILLPVVIALTAVDEFEEVSGPVAKAEACCYREKEAVHRCNPSFTYTVL